MQRRQRRRIAGRRRSVVPTSSEQRRSVARRWWRSVGGGEQRDRARQRGSLSVEQRGELTPPPGGLSAGAHPVMGGEGCRSRGSREGKDGQVLRVPAGEDGAGGCRWVPVVEDSPAGRAVPTTGDDPLTRSRVSGERRVSGQRWSRFLECLCRESRSNSKRICRG